MISRLSSALALFVVVFAAQAQGVISPVGVPAQVAPETAPAPQSTPAPSIGNPFKPQAPTVPAEDLPPPPPAVDPVIAAIAEEFRVIREQGERLGTVDGKIIYRHKGQYLIEALPEADKIPAAVEKARLPAETCVIRVVHESAGPVSSSEQTTSNR